MCMGLSRDRSLGLARPLADDIGLTFGQKLGGWERRPQWAEDLSSISNGGLTRRDTCRHVICPV
jgi:hypothetical protein